MKVNFNATPDPANDAPQDLPDGSKEGEWATRMDQVPEAYQPPKGKRRETPLWARLLIIDDADLISDVKELGVMEESKNLPEGKIGHKALDGRPFLKSDSVQEWREDMRTTFKEMAREIARSDSSSLREELGQIRTKLHLVDTLTDQAEEAADAARRLDSKKRLDQIQEIVWERLLRRRALYTLKQDVYRKAAKRVEDGEALEQGEGEAGDPRTEDGKWPEYNPSADSQKILNAIASDAEYLRGSENKNAVYRNVKDEVAKQEGDQVLSCLHRDIESKNLKEQLWPGDVDELVDLAVEYSAEKAVS